MTANNITIKIKNWLKLFSLFISATYNVQCVHNCDNTPGSFKCSCITGYKLDLDGFSCSPEVECDVNNNCQSGCIKVEGVDTCTCNPGYMLAADNQTCNDIDECTEGTDDCANNTGVCTNTDGSYQCACTDNFILGPSNECDGKSFEINCG